MRIKTLLDFLLVSVVAFVWRTRLVLGILFVSVVAFASAYNLIETKKLYLKDPASVNKISVEPPSLSGSYTLKLPVDDGLSNQFLKTDGSGNTSWDTVTASPGGVSGNVQYNNAGAFAGSNNLFWDIANDRLGVGTTTPNARLDVKSTLALSGATSGFVAMQSPAAPTSYTMTLPSAQGSAGTFLSNDGAGNLSWASSSGTPAGADTQVQFNNAGAFGASSSFTFNDTNKRLSLFGVNPETGYAGPRLQLNAATGTTSGGGARADFVVSRGTFASPTATQIGDQLSTQFVWGRGTSGGYVASVLITSQATAPGTTHTASNFNIELNNGTAPTNAWFLEGANGKVTSGVNTPALSGKLYVGSNTNTFNSVTVGSNTGATEGHLYANDGGAEWGLYSTTANRQFRVFNTGTLRMIIDTAGKTTFSDSNSFNAAGTLNASNNLAGDNRTLYLHHSSATATPNGMIYGYNENTATTGWSFLKFVRGIAGVQFEIGPRGQISAPNIHNQGGDITSGTWTPATVTNGTVLANSGHYTRVGSVINFSIGITSTAAGTVSFTLPVASNFVNLYDCSGAVSQSAPTSYVISADTTNDRCQASASAGGSVMGFSGTYVIQ